LESNESLDWKSFSPKVNWRDFNSRNGAHAPS
jgi:hypothetical protein